MFLLALFGGSEHAIFHETALEATVHALQTIGISDAFEIRLGLEDPSTWILDALHDGMTPRCDGLLDPICGGNLVHHARLVNQLGVGLLGDEVRVTPVAAE